MASPFSRTSRVVQVPKPDFDVGIVVALPEEFGYLTELLPSAESIRFEGTYFYRLDLTPVSAICCLAGQMGKLPAMSAANHLLTYADVKVLILLGLAGAIDSDVEIGDVVVADEVNEFQASSKAASTTESYQVQYSGRHRSLEFIIKESIRHFQYACPDSFMKWQAQIADDFDAIDVPDKEAVCSLPAKLHLGPMASGDVVAASSAFLDEIRRINRKFLAIDMEAAGVTYAAIERIHPVHWLVIRGISDRGDEQKKSLEDSGVWRRYCARNAIGLLRGLLSWDGFRTACGLGPSPPSMDNKSIPKDLVLLVRSRVGAAWLVGVAFGLYSHGPHISDAGVAIPLDLSYLRVLDGRTERLIESSAEAKQRALATGDLAAAAEEFVSLVEEYRSQFSSNGLELLLRSFDQVVIETVCPTDDHHIITMVLEADRLGEEVGTEAVAAYLKVHWREDPRLRQRYVETLSDSRDWSTIVDTLKGIEDDELARGELEDLIFAYAKMHDLEPAAASLRAHGRRYNDRGGKLFRRQLSLQFAGLPDVDKELK